MPGLPITFDLLANTDNEAAAPVLLAALDASQRDVRDLAFTSLLARRNATAELNVLRRWSDMSLRWKQQIAERPVGFPPPFVPPSSIAIPNSTSVAARRLFLRAITIRSPC